MTTEHRELSEIVGVCAGAVSGCWEHLDKAGAFQSSEASKFVDEAIAAILAAGYRKPRVITTVKELAAMRKGSVIRTHLGGIWTKYYDRFVEYENWGARGSNLIHPAELPATVLHEGDA